MADKHDAVFKDLIANKDFAISFLQQYMPSELVSLVDWKTVKLDSANVEHTRQQQKINLKQKEQSDLTFLFKFQDGKDGAVFVHIESQTGDDGTIVIRTRHYQTAYLLDYVKRHKTTKDLPSIIIHISPKSLCLQVLSSIPSSLAKSSTLSAMKFENSILF